MKSQNDQESNRNWPVIRRESVMDLLFFLDPERPAIHGKKMPTIEIKFFADQLAKKKGNIYPGHVRDSGVLYIRANTVIEAKDDCGHHCKAKQKTRISHHQSHLARIIFKF